MSEPRQYSCDCYRIAIDSESAATVFLQDFSTGCGRLTVVYEDDAWSHYWSAMGDRDIRSFIATCSSAGYIAGKLMAGSGHRAWRQKERKLEYERLERIVTAIRAAFDKPAGAVP